MLDANRESIFEMATVKDISRFQRSSSIRQYHRIRRVAEKSSELSSGRFIFARKIQRNTSLSLKIVNLKRCNVSDGPWSVTVSTNGNC